MKSTAFCGLSGPLGAGKGLPGSCRDGCRAEQSRESSALSFRRPPCPAGRRSDARSTWKGPLEQQFKSDSEAIRGLDGCRNQVNSTKTKEIAQKPLKLIGNVTGLQVFTTGMAKESISINAVHALRTERRSRDLASWA